MMCVWIKGHLNANSVTNVEIFYLFGAKSQILSSPLPPWKKDTITILYVWVYHVWKAIFNQVSCGQIFIIGL